MRRQGTDWERGEEALAAHNEWQYMLGELLYAFECMTEEMLAKEMLAEDREALELDRANKLVERNWELRGKKGKKPKPVKKLPAAKTAAPAPKARLKGQR